LNQSQNNLKSEKIKKNSTFYNNSTVDKISILKPTPRAVSQVAPKTKTKVSSPLNYSDVFYSNKQTTLFRGKSPRENLRDIFNSDSKMHGSTLQKHKRLGSPIREDDEEE
jgi:hypothetical protein